MTNPPAVELGLKIENPLWALTDAQVQALFEPSRRAAERCGDMFDSLEVFCTFIGYPRSGHSILGSLMDAHPDMIIAHELDALRFLAAGFQSRQIYHLIVENSRLFTRHGRKWGPYSYAVPGQSQGEFTRLRVIGDNKAGQSTMRIGGNWMLLDKLRAEIPLKHRLIHVVRNPWDNIATMSSRNTGGDVVRATERYFFMCETNERLRRELGPQVLDIHHEEFLRSPAECLTRLCGFVGLSADDSWVNACCAIVYRTPHKSRDDIAWPPGTRDIVEREKARYEFLRDYTFDD